MRQKKEIGKAHTHTSKQTKKNTAPIKKKDKIK